MAGSSPSGTPTSTDPTGNIHLAKPIVGMSPTPDGKGYWFVASDGGVFAYGDAHFYGSTGNIRLNQPVTGMMTSPDGRGYTLVANDGGLFCYGDAEFSGSLGRRGDHRGRRYGPMTGPRMP